ncbi:ROK family protein [Helcococcus massiliensis]|uniref:ROK family protein n=1 Tax=Helcococcus massiliensis TaxID=2040290 RepID=UPI0013566F2F|nr:ROK family protein [Helcococcus massiliensis]
MYGAIEAGGTKFVLAVADEKLNILDKKVIATRDSESTMRDVFNFFDSYKNLRSIGIGSFGPIDVVKSSKTYGYITSTPKKGWRNFNFLGSMKDRYQIPIAFTTDVNAACLGENILGSGMGLSSCLYLTVGTGVGGGAIVNGEFVEGFGHPEMGHILIKKDPVDDFEGVCPYHGSCLEGLVSGPSLQARYGLSGKDIEKDHEIWNILGSYLAQALVNYTLILRPEIIILGGGVMKQNQLFESIKYNFEKMINNYVTYPDIDKYIVRPELEDNAGIMGALLLAEREYKK